MTSLHIPKSDSYTTIAIELLHRLSVKMCDILYVQYVAVCMCRIITSTVVVPPTYLEDTAGDVRGYLGVRCVLCVLALRGEVMFQT